MTFKNTPPELRMLDVSLIDANPASPRRHVDETALKGLAQSIRRSGLIHPLLVQPADAGGRHTLIVGERRWRAAVLAGETTVPALIRACDPAEVLEIQVFENLGLGLRSPLEARDMANAIQSVAERFDTREAAAEHFGRSAAWLTQATSAAAANLSPKVAALLDSGKLSGTGVAIQLEKLAQKNEAKAESLMGQIAQLPEGEKLARKAVDQALSEEGGRRRKSPETRAETPPPAQPDAPPPPIASPASPPWDETPAAAPSRRINPGKMRRVATLLGLGDDDEETVLARLVDEFLALKGE